MAKRVSDSPKAKEIIEQSRIIWKSGVIELLQRINTTTSVRETACSKDNAVHYTFAAGSEDIIRLSEVWFPLRALVAKRCQFYDERDYTRQQYRYVWRLGCPYMVHWMLGHGLGIRDPDQVQRGTLAANALCSRSLATVNYAERILKITKEDCRSLMIDGIGPGRTTMNFLTAACCMTSVAAMKDIIKRLELEKRDFFERMPTWSAFAACFPNPGQRDMAQFLCTEAFPIYCGDATKIRYVKIGRSDVCDNLAGYFVDAVQYHAFDTAIWLVEYFKLTREETWPDSALFSEIVSVPEASSFLRYGLQHLWPVLVPAPRPRTAPTSLEHDDAKFVLGLFRLALEKNRPKNAEVLRGRVKPEALAIESSWGDVLHDACINNATESLDWIAANFFAGTYPKNRPWFISTKTKLLARCSDRNCGCMSADWLLKRFGPIDAKTYDALLRSGSAWVARIYWEKQNESCGVEERPAKRRKTET